MNPKFEHVIVINIFFITDYRLEETMTKQGPLNLRARSFAHLECHRYLTYDLQRSETRWDWVKRDIRWTLANYKRQQRNTTAQFTPDSSRKSYMKFTNYHNYTQPSQPS